MSLLRLLAVGRCWDAVRRATGRYRLPKPGALPKFNDERQPEFRSSTLPPSARSRKPDALFEENSSPANPFAEKGDAGANVAPARQTPTEPQVAIRSPAPKKARARWFGNLNPFARQSAHKKPVSANREPVQGELSLENVKVVRNDLSDADLELVPMTPAPKQTPKHPVESDASEPVAVGAKAESAWGRLSARLFDADPTPR